MPRTFRSLAPALLAAALAGALPPATPAAAQEIKIAVIDTEAVLTQSATGKQALADLQALKEKKEGEGKALQDEITDLRRRVNEGRLSLSEDKLAELQQQLEEKTISLQRFQDDANRELNKRKDEILASVDRKVMPVIAQVSQEKGYVLIFRKFESGLVWASDDVDITAEVIARIDAGAAAGSGG
jgi:outer membrane protein